MAEAGGLNPLEYGFDSHRGHRWLSVIQPLIALTLRLASWLMYPAFAGAVITWFVTGDLRSTIWVILVVGACGVVAGTPLASGLIHVGSETAFIPNPARLIPGRSVERHSAIPSTPIVAVAQ